MKTAREEVTRLARLRRRTMRAQRRGDAFDKAWKHVCDVRLRDDLRVHVLDECEPMRRTTRTPSRRIYTDGSMRTKQQNAKAGWAFIVVANEIEPSTGNASLTNETRRTTGADSLVIGAACGRVQTMPGEAGYEGATRHTNNTGELTAMLRALQEELSVDESDGAVEICSDSTYAIGVATGKYAARKSNVELARRVARAYGALCKKRGAENVAVTHVRAHTRIAGNEAADRLAKKSADDETFAGRNERILEEAQALHDMPEETGDTELPEGSDTAQSGDLPRPTSAVGQAPLEPSAQAFSLPVPPHSLGVG